MIHSFLLIGQSNMAGRGFVDEVEPIENPNIKVLRNGRWQKMYVPINCDRRFSGISLAESFADAYQKEHGVEVGLIPCADGGTKLEQWQKGTLLYDNAVFQTKQAERTSHLVGVLWHQGESDCEESLCNTYKERFLKFYNDICTDLQLVETPFLIGELGEYLGETPEYMNYLKINEQLKQIVQEKRMLRLVSSSGLTSNPDNLHFNSKSLREFGLRYYYEFQKIENADRTFTEIEYEDVKCEIEDL